MIEIPSPLVALSNLAIRGRYNLNHDNFGIIDYTSPGKNGESQLPEALLTPATNGMILAYKFKGNRLACGRGEGFVEATNYLSEKSKCSIRLFFLKKAKVRLSVLMQIESMMK